MVFLPDGHVKIMGVMLRAIYLSFAELSNHIIVIGEVFCHYSHSFLEHSILRGASESNMLSSPWVGTDREGLLLPFQFLFLHMVLHHKTYACWPVTYVGGAY